MDKKNVLSQAFTWLCIGLFICFGVSYLATINDEVTLMVYGALGGYAYIIYAVIELVLVIFLAVRIRKMQPLTAKLVYSLYTGFTGLSLGGLFVYYTKSSIAFVFLATAIIVGVFAYIGKHTNMDLTKAGTFLMIALLAIILLELINMFILNNTLNMILCIACIVIFAGYIAYDIKTALMMAEAGGFQNDGIYLAFQLFLDFINIFIRLLQLFGKRD